MEIIKFANLALRFLLELCALAALGYWAFQAGDTLLVKIALAAGAPLIAAIVWGAFIAPRASVPVPTWLWLVLQVAVFGCAATGLVAAGQRTLAVVFVLAVLINCALLYVCGQLNKAGTGGQRSS
jgi:uncharacterized protein DUF2568